MSEILKEGKYIHDIVKWEANDEYSREVVTIASGNGKLEAGTVLEVSASTGKYSKLSYTAADDPTLASVGTPAAVLLQDIDATSADQTAVVVVRSAIVVDTQLVWPTDIDEDSKADAAADLTSLGIVIRKGV